VDVITAGDGAGCLSFLRSLTARGLSGAGRITSHAHAGPYLGDRGYPARSILAALPHPLRHHTCILVAVGAHPAALNVRSATRNRLLRNTTGSSTLCPTSCSRLSLISTTRMLTW
jgi:hypothetical protein